jgi:hypothetical protein
VFPQEIKELASVSPLWCTVVMKARRLKEQNGATSKMNTQSTATVRATISFPLDVYERLEGIAKEKKVSLAWVVREAAEQYIAEKWPLFKGRV